MSDKLTQNLTEATVVDTTNDRVPIYSAASPSELRCMTPDNLIPDASATVKGKVELATSAETITGTDTVRAVTPAGAAAAIAASVANYQPLDSDLTAFSSHPTYITTLNINPLYAPQGFLINGKIVPSVSSNNLTVALKTLAGTDPSATDPVYCRIGDTVRGITSALSVTKNAATNWCNAGSAELATKEIDYFVYLGYNATDGVVIGFSRYPGANSYDDFSATTTNEKYCAISTITNAAATDYYEVIGRFAATLSAGAGYTWSVPTYTAKNLIQRPIYESRMVITANNFYIKIVGSSLYVSRFCPITMDGATNGYGYLSLTNIWPGIVVANKILSISAVCGGNYYSGYMSAIFITDSNNFQFRVNNQTSGNVYVSAIFNLG